MFVHALKLHWLEMSDGYWARELFALRQLSASGEQEITDAQLKALKERNKQYAYRMLKETTGQDFGWDLVAWEEWLRRNTRAFDYG